MATFIMPTVHGLFKNNIHKCISKMYNTWSNIDGRYGNVLFTSMKYIVACVQTERCLSVNVAGYVVVVVVVVEVS